MVDIRSLISQIPMEPGYVPAPPEPDLSVIQRLMGLPQTLRAVGQNLAVGAASLPVGIYQGFGDPSAGEAAMSQFQQDYGYTPTNPAAQRQLQGLGEFLQQLETEYKIPPMISPSQLPSRAATAGSAMQLGRIGTRMTGQAQDLARDLVREIQTTPPTGAVTMAPSSLPRSDIGFYSQLEAVVQPLQNKGTGQQYLAQIQKSAGVKPEEIQWTGLDTFLQGKQSVTKQEIQDYLNANRVDVQEVRLGENFAPGYQFSTYNEWENALDQAEAAGDVAEVSRLNEWAKLRYDTPNQTKFSSYTLPGGENYREILLTLPAKQLTEAEARVVLGAAPDAKLSSADIAYASRKNVDEYRTTHFDQPNILAHLRVNDRTVDGKKTLFVEEIQSDWHQAGRKKGYGPQTETEAYYITPDGSRVSLGFGKTQEEAAAAVDPGWKNLVDIKFDTQTKKFGEGVPDAPFKTSWHELSLKRAIQEAAEKGYDQIAFTTGKTQAERYDLSKQINSIAVPSILGNSRSVRINAPSESFKMMVDNDGIVTGYYSATQFTGKPLDEVVGKEMAAKIMEATEPKEFSGLDLQVGGEGMKGFYDNILPKSLDKLGKKFDAKVTKTTMKAGESSLQPSMVRTETGTELRATAKAAPEVEIWKMDITPQMRESVTTKGQPLFAIPAIGAVTWCGNDARRGTILNCCKITTNTL
jgi:hypothetical protein